MHEQDSSVAKNSFTGELVHFGIVRMRVTGTGNLQLFLHSLDDASHSNTLVSTPMQLLTNREPTTLANFIDQYGQLHILTTIEDEVFEVSKIVMFVRPVASGYPQV